jgi:hypothetical protein
MKDWYAFKKFQAWWMSTDGKPDRKVRRSIKRGARSNAKKDIRKEVVNGGDE